MKGRRPVVLVAVMILLLVLAGCGKSPAAPAPQPAPAPAPSQPAAQPAAPAPAPAPAPVPSEPVPGVTDNSIKLGVTTILSGPVAFAGIAGQEAVKAYFSHLNEQGGIHGRTFTWVIEDNQYEPQASIATVKKLLTRDEVFALPIAFGTVVAVAIKELVTEEQVPALAIGGGEPIYDPPSRYLFMAGTPYTWQAAIAAEYIATDLGGQGKAKLALIYQDDDMGKAFVAGVEKTAAHFGMDLVATVPIARGSTDASAQVAAVAARDPDYILAGTILADTASILREVQKLGLRARVIGTGQPSMHARLIELAGAEAVKDYVGVKDFAAWTDDVPGMNELRAVAEKYAPAMIAEENEYFIASYVNSMLMARAMEQAGRNLTREAVTDALSAMVNVDTGGLTSPVSFGPDKRFSGTGGRVYRLNLQTNSVEAITDWMQPTVYSR